MRILNFIEIEPKEIWELLFLPSRNLRKIKRKNFGGFLNNITWEYQTPLFKRSINIRKEDIFKIRPLCRKCLCELRQDFTYPIQRTTWYVFKFTCPNCNLVHDINAESLSALFEDLKIKLAYFENSRRRKI